MGGRVGVGCVDDAGLGVPSDGETVNGSTSRGVTLGRSPNPGVKIATSGSVAVGGFSGTGAFPAQPVKRLMISVLIKRYFRLSIGLPDYTSPPPRISGLAMGRL